MRERARNGARSTPRNDELTKEHPSPYTLVVGAVSSFLSGRAKTKQRKDAGCVDSCAIGAPEDAAMRRFAAARADNRTCGRDHSASPENVHGARRDHQRQEEARRRLEEHEHLRPATQGHRIRRTERRRVRERDVEVVDCAFAPVTSRWTSTTIDTALAALMIAVIVSVTARRVTRAFAARSPTAATSCVCGGITMRAASRTAVSAGTAQRATLKTPDDGPTMNLPGRVA
jgi:hypothetical protein